MDLRFNGGRGALLCDKCRVIVMEDFNNYEWEACRILQNQKYEWFCKKCNPERQREQDQKFVDVVNNISDKFQIERKNEMIQRYGIYKQ